MLLSSKAIGNANEYICDYNECETTNQYGVKNSEAIL